MDTLQQNWTQDLVVLLKGESTVGCKWVFSVKYFADGQVDRYKAHFIAKGFTHIAGKDFGATFAPVTKLNTIRLLIFLVASYSQPLH